MLENVNRAIKRLTSKLKLSQLKQIKKQLVKKCKIWEKNLLNMNDKLLRKIKKSRYEKDIEFAKLFDRNLNFLQDEKRSVPIKTMFVEK